MTRSPRSPRSPRNGRSRKHVDTPDSPHSPRTPRGMKSCKLASAIGIGSLDEIKPKPFVLACPTKNSKFISKVTTELESKEEEQSSSDELNIAETTKDPKNFMKKRKEPKMESGRDNEITRMKKSSTKRYTDTTTVPAPGILDFVPLAAIVIVSVIALKV